MLLGRLLIVEWAPLSSTLTFIAAHGSARRRGEILIGRELRHVIGQVATAHGTKCIKEDGRDNLHQLYCATGPATMPTKTSGNAAKKSGKGDKQKRKESYAIYI